MLNAVWKDRMAKWTKGKDLETNGDSKRACYIWGGFTTFVCLIYLLISSGHGSFSLTLGSILSVFSFATVAVNTGLSGDCAGVSVKMMECYVLVFACRLVAIVPYEGYLPADASGDWFYQVCEACGLLSAAATVLSIRNRSARGHDLSLDSFTNLWLVVPCAVLALVLHPRRNEHFVSDVAWAFALYLEAVSALPQLHLFLKDARAQTHMSHFLFAQMISKVISFFFWAQNAHELAHEDDPIKWFVGHWVVIAQFVQLAILADFAWYYIQALQRGISITEAMSCSHMV